MKQRELRSPKARVGTLGNAALPPPDDPPPPPTETVLCRALVEGDELALAAAVGNLRTEMLRLAAAYVRSEDDAEDVVQDTWIAALAGIDRFEGRSSLRTWLLRILTYRARSASRRGSRFLPLSQIEGSSAADGDKWSRNAVPLHPGPNPAEVVIGRELRNRIDSALLELPTRQREVVRLRDLEGWTTKEVCARLRLSPGNQRVLLHRGRLQLREIVAESEVEQT